jgi:hypothetical protein
MSLKPRQTSLKFKSNPRTIKYILKNNELVDRALKHADIIFPKSTLIPVNNNDSDTFKERSFWALDRLIKRIEPKIDDSLLDTIIVETQLSVDKLVAVRANGYDAAIVRFKLVDGLIRKMATNLTSTIEILNQISSDLLLLSTVADTMKGFQKDSDDFFSDLAKKFADAPFDLLNFIPETKRFLYIAMILERINTPLLRLKEDLADSKLIRSAAEYRCASALAWIWWEHLGRHPTTTRNVEARPEGTLTKTAFQSFVDEAVPPPRLSEGIMRKVYDDLRFITNVGIAEKDARELLLKARSNPKIREIGIQDARSLLIFARAALGDRGRRNSQARNPQV